jgi:hypothetical protein
VTPPSLSLEALEQLLEPVKREPGEPLGPWLDRKNKRYHELVVALRNYGPALVAGMRALEEIAAMPNDPEPMMYPHELARAALAPFSEGAETHGT